MNNIHTRYYYFFILCVLCAALPINPLHADANPFVKQSSSSLNNLPESNPFDVVGDLNTHVDIDAANPLAPQLPLDLQARQKKPVPDRRILDSQATIEFNFEDADLQNLVTQISELFGYTFITDEAIDPIGPNGKTIKGNKISFKTQKPLTKQQAWDLFVTFLNLAGLNLAPQADEGFFKITKTETFLKSAIPSYIGVHHEKLPDSDQMIRYVYFVENSTVKDLYGIVDDLKSTSARAIALQEHKAFIVTDKAYNVKSLMRIVKELDKVSMPQSMSVLKLRRADAIEVKKLYDSLTQKDPQGARSRMLARRRKSTSLYFPESIEIIAEPRTNALILFGSKNEVQKVEDFIIKHVDIDLDQPYSPLRVHQLRYADAQAVAEIMNSLNDFGRDTEAGKSGGVRGEDKYMKSMNFTAEKETNRLIIQGDEEDYLRAKEIVEKLDSAQPQVAIEVLILAVQLGKRKELGSQIRSKTPGPSGLLGNNVKFQTSGIRFGSAPSSIEENTNGTGITRLLGDLVNLVSGAGPGNTVLTLGMDQFGVWGIFNALQTITNAQVVSNPFLVATNKTPAVVSIGETRRVVTGTVKGTQDTDTQGDSEANLTVNITPQINSDGMIILDLTIDIVDFVNSLDLTDPTKNERKIQTKTIVADKEVLALGGLIRSRTDNSMSKTPLLGNIPILGWLFKNRSTTQSKENLLILISSQIIEPLEKGAVEKITRKRVDEYHDTIARTEDPTSHRDPIHNWYFKTKDDSSEAVLEDFLFKRKGERVKEVRAESRKREKQEKETRRERRGRRRREKQETQRAVAKNTKKSPRRGRRHRATRVAHNNSTPLAQYITKAEREIVL